MKALLVRPGRPGVSLGTVDEPGGQDGEVLIEAVALGICGTDREIAAGLYGAAPPGETQLILGHESLGRVIDAPENSGLVPGDHVAGIVRRPDPEPCPNCAIGEWDMCQNGRYTEHGIKERPGFGAERFRLPVGFVVKVDPALGLAGVLLEPASVVAKAWQHIERIGQRARWTPRRVLVTGAGPVGLLAALLAVQRGFEVQMFDRVTSGPKPELAAVLGATYRTDLAEVVGPIDILIECTGAGQLVFQAMRLVTRNGIVCLTGVSSGRREIPVDVAALNRELVLENAVVFGTVNANRLHFELAAEALAAADPSWLRSLLTREVPLARWETAFEREPDDVKVVLRFTRGGAESA
jgi:threonine dehydrogenase-like Zn-dependent dehydrogenase